MYSALTPIEPVVMVMPFAPTVSTVMLDILLFNVVIWR
jgi:hypothetical protein